MYCPILYDLDFRIVVVRGTEISIHEPEVRCISKGKEHKTYEFGRAANRSKVSIALTQTTGVIIGALNIAGNQYDGHTLEAVLEQQKRLSGHVLSEVFVDRGYRGVTKVGQTTIHSPKTFNKKISRYKQKKLRNGFTRRAAIEPVIGHLKANYRLSRNFYKGIKGDTINVMLAAAAMNFKRMINIWKEFFLAILLNMNQLVYRERHQQYLLKSLFKA